MTFDISENDQLKEGASITGNEVICAGGNISLLASGGTTYFWWNRTNNTPAMTVNLLYTTTYYNRDGKCFWLYRYCQGNSNDISFAND